MPVNAYLMISEATSLKSLIKIVANVNPVPFKRAIPGKPVHNDPRYAEYKEVLGYFALKAMRGQEPLKGAIKMTVDVYKQKPKDVTSRNYGDLDNHVKAIMDALTGICYEDDRQVCEITARKFFGQSKVIITLEVI